MARFENSTFKLVLESCQTFAENYFMNFFFLQICTFYVSGGKTQFSQLPNYEKLESPKTAHPILYSV